jgi:predicted metal-dependent HD superfamily phosphohydrolase
MSQRTIRFVFDDAWQGCGLFPNTHGYPVCMTTDPLKALKTLYDDPPRVYHNWNHAVACVSLGVEYKLPPPAIMALFYHDCVYIPGCGLNEEESTVRLREHFSEDPPVNPKKSQLDLIAYLIMSTKHEGVPGTLLEAYVRDIDMSILGQDEATFAAYDRAIRQENIRVPEEMYEEKRIAFLSGLFRKERIFYTSELHHAYEAQARFNISARIAQGSPRKREQDLRRQE